MNEPKFKFINNENKTQDEIPYEYRMKFIIEGYRRNLQQLDELMAYARKLEQKIDDERERRAAISLKSRKMAESVTEKRRENKRLKVRIAFLCERITEIKAYCDQGLPVPDELWPKNLFVDEIED